MPVIAIAVALAWRVLPAVRSPEAKGIDPMGTLLAVVGGGALLLTLIEGPRSALAGLDGAAAAAVGHRCHSLRRHLLTRTPGRHATSVAASRTARDRFFSRADHHHPAHQLTTSLLLATALVLQSGLGFARSTLP